MNTNHNTFHSLIKIERGDANAPRVVYVGGISVLLEDL